MIRLKELLGCVHCGNIYHVHKRYRIRCPHCGYGLNHSEKIAWNN